MKKLTYKENLARQEEVAHYLKKTYPNKTKSFIGNDKAIKDVIRIFEFHPGIHKEQFAKKLDRLFKRSVFTNSTKKNRIPVSNREGEKRSKDPKEIVKLDNFLFRSRIVKEFLPPKEYLSFVQKYCNLRTKFVGGRTFVPSKEEISAFKDYQNDKINLIEFSKLIGSKMGTCTFSKVGKIINYLKNK